MTTPSGAGANPEPPRETRICKALVATPVSGTKAALLDADKWQLGETIRIRFVEGDSGLQRRVANAAQAWTQGVANLRFDFVNDGTADVRIAFQQGAGSWSYIGTECRNYPGEPTMNFGWLTPESSDEEIRSVVLHEFGHMIGLIHEHQNPKRAISWNRAAVIRDLSGPPNNWDEATIQHNIFDKYDPAKVTATDVDRYSIMMYKVPVSWTTDGFFADFNSDLSDNDKQLVGQVYPS